ncbi:MAG: type I 3-dehydroquinate dehydratase [Clostridiales bacterium]|jgi:3-dehydroquinate dehydratase-1|uniref:type I 3-dehydroquinate dehydratase n=1 Tax=Aminipila sp. TaxID=2060095 RepID=UPI001D812CA8|nr:type I 3-dehydroquinate dehydratase [Aminipila sp.]MBE6035436.1 type I 3-dehydroquinate dehydratase [Clostridiales bacterium]
MHSLKVRNLIIGEGIPKICVSILGRTKKQILHEAEAIAGLPVDLVEWRADWFDEISNLDLLSSVLRELRSIMKNIPILFTFRTASEGGQKTIGVTDYVELNKTAAATGHIDLIDIEAFMDNLSIPSILPLLHPYKVKMLLSNHDFKHTPPKEEIIARLRKMQDLGADIAKIAVMPSCSHDVAVLLSATAEMNEKYAECPIVTMSMSKSGSISRISGEYFGSAITFAAAEQASAPGQIALLELHQMLRTIHQNLI